MATPNSGAAFAEYISEEKQMSFDIEIDAFSKKEFDIEVLCFLPRHYENFGFFWFQVTEIVVREQCFFGDFCVKNPNDLAGSWYENQYNGDLLIDMPAIFKIHVFDNGVEVPNSPFTNASDDANWGVGSPLCVQYPDNLGEINNFEFVLYIHVPVGDGFDWVEFHTWTITDDEEFFDIAGDGVVDFVLGNCVYSDTDLLLAPYMNLPETAEIELIYDNRQGPGYWELDIESFNPAGTYDIPLGYMAGWCGDANTTIQQKGYTFHVYSSLYPASWPSGLPASFDVNKINQINWLFNNLGSYGFTISGLYIEIGELTQDDGLIIQDAVWTIMHGANNFTAAGNDITLSQTMAVAASTHGSFSPLPGGWAAIIMVPEVGGIPDATKAQLILTVVDP